MGGRICDDGIYLSAAERCLVDADDGSEILLVEDPLACMVELRPVLEPADFLSVLTREVGSVDSVV